jgi:ketosteroid isomerase-like protein
MSFSKYRWASTLGAAGIAAALLLVSGTGMRAKAQSSAQDEVLAMEKKFTGACVAGDTATLNSIMADDALFIHGNGVVQTKAELVDAIATGTLPVGQYDMSEPKVILFDGGAIISGIVDFGFRSPAGSASPSRPLHMRGSSVWVNHAGKWQLYLAQDTTLSGPGSR